MAMMVGSAVLSFADGCGTYWALLVDLICRVNVDYLSACGLLAPLSGEAWASVLLHSTAPLLIVGFLIA
jgi:hypothetical protein